MDLVLLSGNRTPLPLSSNTLSRVDCGPSVLAIVRTSSRREGLSMSVLPDAWFEFTTLLTQKKIVLHKVAGQAGKVETHMLHYTILDSLVSPWREFNAIHAIQDMNLRDIIIGDGAKGCTHIEGYHGGLDLDDENGLYIPPSESSSCYQQSLSPLPHLPASFSKTMYGKYNSSQFSALHTVMQFSSKEALPKATKITLVQGPPGTGKTSTVLGILNSLHVLKFNSYFEEVLMALLGSAGMRCRLSQDQSRWIAMLTSISRPSKPRILAVAPSNVAIDNIIEPILAKGFVDGNGATYLPSMLRLGGGKSNRVECISLEGTLRHFDDLSNAECTIGAEDLYKRIEVCLLRVQHLQAMLLTLKKAWEMCPNLPSEIELRVTIDTAKPYWVNHNTRTTSNLPPNDATRAQVQAHAQMSSAVSEGKEDEAAISSSPILGPFIPRTPSPLDEDVESMMSSPSSPPKAKGEVEVEEEEEEEEGDAPPPPPPPLPLPSHQPLPATRVAGSEKGNAPAPVPAPPVFTRVEEDETRAFCIMFPKGLRSLPEFGIHARTLTSEVDQISNMALQAARLRSRGSFRDGKEYADSMHRAMSSRLALETSVIDEAHIVFTTLNSSGHPCLEGSSFNVAIIDEAAQCSEPSLLIPLRLGVKHCVMVGDPRQLPATIFSDVVRKYNYSRSLFERLMELGHKRVMLDTQYRMAPVISTFPAQTFYGGLLKDGANVKHRDYVPCFLGGGSPGGLSNLKPFLFFDLLSSRESTGGGGSYSNIEEVRLCLKVVNAIVGEAKTKGVKCGSIGIITPYQNQLRELRRAFTDAGLNTPPASSSAAGSSSRVSTNMLDIELNTVDAFQGREKDIILMSCVRADDSGKIGFLSDKRRMNVALTRAKHALFVVGRGETLQHNATWGAFLEAAHRGKSIVTVSSSSDSLRSALENHAAERGSSAIQDSNDHVNDASHSAKRQRVL
jgi:hypothetical protein